MKPYTSDVMYQMQYLKPYHKDWSPYGTACTRSEANKLFFEFICHQSTEEATAIRIASVWKCYDDVWRIKEIVEYRDVT